MLLMAGLALAADPIDPKNVTGKAQPAPVAQQDQLQGQAEQNQRQSNQTFPRPGQAQPIDDQRVPRGPAQPIDDQRVPRGQAQQTAKDYRQGQADYYRGNADDDNYRRGYQAWDPRDAHAGNYASHGAPQDRYYDQRRPAAGQDRPRKKIEIVTEKDGTKRFELARMDDDDWDGDDRFVEVGGAWRVHNVNPDPSEKDDKPTVWNFKFIQADDADKVKQLEAQKDKDGKEIVKREEIINQDLKLLDKVRAIESKGLTEGQNAKAGKLEAKLTDQVRREERKIESLKGDERQAKTAEKIIRTLDKLNRIESAPVAEPTTPEQKISQVFDNKLRETRNIELAQQIVAPKVIDQIKSELKRLDNEAGEEKAAPKIRSPEVKEVVVTQPLKPDTPLAETLVKALQTATKNGGAGSAVFVGSGKQ